MSKLQFRVIDPSLAMPKLISRVLFLCVSFTSFSVFVHAQESEKRGRKYNPPPATAHVSVAVIKDTNSKPVENAAVIFHITGEEGKGNMEMKTNGEGKAAIDVIPIGDTLRLQVIANGFQTFGEDYKIDAESRDIVVRLKRPSRQYSTYEHPADAQSTPPPASDPSASSPKPADAAPPPQH